MNAYQLLRQQQANNRASYAKKLKAQVELENSQQQFSGRILGGNADGGAIMVQLADGGIVACQAITNGFLKPGQNAIVTFNGNKAWVDGMPI
jgi:hypothetical protein